MASECMVFRGVQKGTIRRDIDKNVILQIKYNLASKFETSIGISLYVCKPLLRTGPRRRPKCEEEARKEGGMCARPLLAAPLLCVCVCVCVCVCSCLPLSSVLTLSSFFSVVASHSVWLPFSPHHVSLVLSLLALSFGSSSSSHCFSSLPSPFYRRRKG